MHNKASLAAFVSIPLYLGLFVWLQPCVAEVTGASNVATDDEAPANPASPKHYHLQLKRQATDRGTDGESTKTTLRWEMFPTQTWSLLRVELPLPDDKTDMGGSPFNPKLGDLKLRADLAPRRWLDLPWIFYVELTLPTADPASLGSGKYQLAPAVRSSMRQDSNNFSGLIKQVVSVGGDPNRKDINYTSIEAAADHSFDATWSAKFTLKPTFDWQQNGASGGVGELEGTLRLSPQWDVALMGGGRLWGGAIPSTYGSRIQLTLNYRY